jgi:hypothetical protein
MTIVYARAPKRQKKPKPPAAELPKRVVTDGKTKKRIKPEQPPDPEADARVAEWFKRNIVPPVR